MPRTLFSLLLAAALASLAGAQPSGGIPYAPAEIQRDPANGILPALIQAGTDIDDVDARTITVYINEQEFQWAQDQGWSIQWIPNAALFRGEELRRKGQKQGNPVLDYHSYAEMTTALEDYASDFPNICRLESIGQSVQGRELWMLKITDNPDTEEDEPEFHYISTMHGDEPVGTEVMLDLIDRLLNGYGSDTRLTSLVDETEIWIMPLMNPDGWENGPARRNANNVDLNRSFPSWICGDENSTTGREPETAAMMNWVAGQRGILSANFHTGALVANYPYDECSTCGASCSSSLTPDDDVFQLVSLAYSENHGRMSDSTQFTDGITNGVAWFAIYGGMQDWNNRWMGGMQITVELNDEKFPPASELPSLIQENQESVLAYMEWVHRGVRGIVSDGDTGQPLDAEVRVVGRDFSVYTDPAVGDYHRVLAPGTYDLEFQAAGFSEPILVEDVVVDSGSATRVDVEFAQPLGANSWRLY